MSERTSSEASTLALISARLGQNLSNPDATRAPLIAIDLDDVLSTTGAVAADWHNKTYGTAMDLSTFYYYHWWKNPMWGTEQETAKKVAAFYTSGLPYRAPPIPGAQAGVRALLRMGFRLAIVTSREPHEMEATHRWLDEHFEGVFEAVICLSTDPEAAEQGKGGPISGPSKPSICAQLGAICLIDDRLEHALECVAADPPIPVLLFGMYEWSKRLANIDVQDPKTLMDFMCRLEYEGEAFWLRDEMLVSDSVPMTRVQDWSAVVAFINQASHTQHRT